mmetsp:Transcript_20515/g.22722  ORF Transcript_20515/g.22722 Transcript_20515/m.22722 type:complete len:84 (-) Transcript_20515:375-626(-)
MLEDALIVRKNYCGTVTNIALRLEHELGGGDEEGPSYGVYNKHNNNTSIRYKQYKFRVVILVCKKSIIERGGCRNRGERDEWT